ncbi:hypothetical protein M3Y97_00349300 [Aphelenchoides bicaudatus]|nr:hypothetical protein M3Y97_00349300 [Aphelenchoides bicaudatus]
MIHPISVEADLMSANPKRPQLYLPRQKASLTYGKDGRKFLNGILKSPTSPNSLWNSFFVRSFTHRLASVANVSKDINKDDEKAETSSIDSFIDVVDLKPDADQKVLNAKHEMDRANNNEDEMLPETYIQGPKATSTPIHRRTSQKVERNAIQPLIQSCCTDIQNNFKEFLRFDFSHTQNIKQSNQQITLTPDSYGKRIWTHDTDKPRSPLMNAICFKISSIVAKADMLTIKVNATNPSSNATQIKVIIHIHVATEQQIGQLLQSAEQAIKLPSDCPLGTSPFEFDIPLNEELREQIKSDEEFLLITMMGKVLCCPMQNRLEG